MLELYLTLIEEEAGKEKFERLYYRYRSLMHYIAVKILEDDFLAEDAVQEMFLRVARNFQKVGSVESVQTRNFLAVITRNVALSIAKTANRQAGVAAAEKQEPEWDRRDMKNAVPDSAFDAVSVTELKKAILALPEHYRMVLYLAGVYEYNLAEISVLLGIPPETVKKRMQRGRRLLWKSLGKEEED